MIVLGLVLVLVAAAAGIAVTVGEPAASMTVTVFNRTYELTSTEMFFIGAAAAALFLLGFALIVRGGRRGAVRRQRLRDARLEARDRVVQLEDEKRELERRLENAPASSDDRLVAGGRQPRRVDEPVGESVEPVGEPADAPAERR